MDSIQSNSAILWIAWVVLIASVLAHTMRAWRSDRSHGALALTGGVAILVLIALPGLAPYRLEAVVMAALLLGVTRRLFLWQ